MKKTILALVPFVFYTGLLTAQSITGNLTQLGGQEIRLEGFSGLKTYPISSVTMDEKGNFSLTYTKSDYGVGYLMSADDKPLFVILSGEDMELVGEALSYPETLKITIDHINWMDYSLGGNLYDKKLELLLRDSHHIHFKEYFSLTFANDFKHRILQTSANPF